MHQNKLKYKCSRFSMTLKILIYKKETFDILSFKKKHFKKIKGKPFEGKIMQLCRKTSLPPLRSGLLQPARRASPAAWEHVPCPLLISTLIPLSRSITKVSLLQKRVRNKKNVGNGWTVWESNLWKCLLSFKDSTNSPEVTVCSLLQVLFWVVFEDDVCFPSLPSHCKLRNFLLSFCLLWFCFLKTLNHIFQNHSIFWNLVRQKYLIIQEGSIHHPPVLPQHISCLCWIH